SANCMIDTWGWTPSAQAYDSSLCTTAAIAGSGSTMPAGAYIIRPRLGVSCTVAPATLPVPDSDLTATATTPPDGFIPIATRLLKCSVVISGISTWATVPVETRNCWSRVGAMLGAVADSVSVVLAGTSRLNAPVLSTVACSPEVRTVTVAPATGAPVVSRTWPVTVARSVPVVGVSGAVWTIWFSAQPASEAITTTSEATGVLMNGPSYCTGNADLMAVDRLAATADQIAIALEGFHALVQVGVRSWVRRAPTGGRTSSRRSRWGVRRDRREHPIATCARTSGLR